MTTAKNTHPKSKRKPRSSGVSTLGRANTTIVRFNKKKDTERGITKKSATAAARKLGVSMNRFFHIAVARYILTRLYIDPECIGLSDIEIAHVRKIANPISKKTGKRILPKL